MPYQISLKGNVVGMDSLKGIENRLEGSTILDSLPYGLVELNTDGKISFMNSAAMHLFGYDDGEGLYADGLFITPYDMELSDYLLGCSGHELTAVSKDGTTFPIVAKSFATDNDSIGLLLDLSSRETSYWQTHDTVTTLLNKEGFEEKLAPYIQTAKEGKEHALLFLDIDGFRTLQDTYGTSSTKALLRQVGDHLQDEVRGEDIVARLDHNGFGVLLADCPLDNATVVANNLRRSIAKKEFETLEHKLQITTSIGLVSTRGGTDIGITNEAYMACHVAKSRGTNRLHVSDPDDSQTMRRRGARKFFHYIQRALDEGRFQLYYQKIVSTNGPDDGAHYEVLIRMVDEKGDKVLPWKFIPAAERYGLMPKIDRWVVKNYFGSYSTLHKDQKLHKCAINLSGDTLSDESFLDFVDEQFKTYDVPPEKICFEITETATITNLAQATRFISAFKEIGCKFSLDDFGVGLSNFDYLRNLAVNYIKIDGSLVKDILKDPINLEMVSAIKRIASVMGIKTIAEYVENTEIFDKLREIGVDYAQGFALARPQPLL